VTPSARTLPGAYREDPSRRAPGCAATDAACVSAPLTSSVSADLPTRQLGLGGSRSPRRQPRRTRRDTPPAPPRDRAGTADSRSGRCAGPRVPRARGAGDGGGVRPLTRSPIVGPSPPIVVAREAGRASTTGVGSRVAPSAYCCNARLAGACLRHKITKPFR
jgi:hypothetical protein